MILTLPLGNKLKINTKNDSSKTININVLNLFYIKILKIRV